MDEPPPDEPLLPWDIQKRLLEIILQDDKMKAPKLSFVCTKWNNVVTDPAYWEILRCDMAMPEEYVTTFWTKMPVFVRDTPATIVIANIGDPNGQPLKLCLLETKAIKRLVLRIASPEGLVEIASIFKEGTTMPPIELALEGEEEHACTHMQWPSNLLANFPRITKLCLNGFSSGFGPGQSLAHIPSLILGNTMDRHIFKILPFIPNLECLDICGSRLFSPPAKVKLSNLHTLKAMVLSAELNQLEITELKHLTIHAAGPSLIEPAFIKNCRLIETLVLGGSFNVAEVNTVAPNVKRLHLLNLTGKLEVNALFPPFLPCLTEIIIHTPNDNLDKETFIALVHGRCLPFCKTGMQKLIIQTVQWGPQIQDGWWNTQLYQNATKKISVLDGDNDPCCFMKLWDNPRCIQIELMWF